MTQYGAISRKIPGRLGLYIPPIYLFLFLFFAISPASHAQVVQLEAGSSTLYGNSGATVIAYLPGQEITASVGYELGYRFSVSDTFKIDGYDITVGDRQFFFLTGQTGLGVASRGISIGSKHLQFFVGESGTIFSSPFFQGFGASHFGAGIFYSRKWEHVQIASLVATQGNKRTLLQSANLEWHGLKGTVAGGMLQNDLQFNGQVEYKFRRRAYFVASSNTYSLPTGRYDVEFVSAGSAIGPIDGSVSLFHSSQGIGDTANAGLRLGFVTVRETVARSMGEDIALTSATVTPTRHWSATGTYAQGGFSFGGSYHSNRLTASIGQNIFFDITSGRFQKSTLASLTVIMGSASMNLASFLGSERLYTLSASDYLGEPLQAGSGTRRLAGAHVLTGICVDTDSQPVSGCAVQVGREVIYSDASGKFFTRARFSSASLKVLPSEFSASGNWRIESSPDSISDGVLARIIVVRSASSR